jgi:signal transduction histidine kinase/HAMP domain-containing protein
MTIRQTLVVSTVVSTSLVIVAGSIGSLNRRAVEHDLQAVEQESLPMVKALEDMRFAGLRIVASTSEYVLLHTVSDRRAHATTGEVELRETGVRLFTQALERLRRLDAGRAVAADGGPLVSAGQALISGSRRLMDASLGHVDADALLDVKERFEAEEQAFLALVDREIAHAAAGLHERSTAVRERVVRDYRTSAVVLVLAGLLALGVGWHVARRVGRPLDLLRGATERLGAGESFGRLPVEASDEIGDVARAFDRMAATLGSTTVSKAFVDDIVASIPDGLVVTDSARRIVRTNRAFVDLLRLPDDRRLTGRALDDVLPGLSPVAGTRTAAVIDLRAGDAVVPVAVAVSPVAGDGGDRGFVCLVQDIGERLAVERALTEARDEAEAGMRAKADFLATMSHELRTPLNAVIGYAELLIDEAGPRLAESDRRDLERIRTSGRMLLDLVNQVLDLARLDAGRAELRPESVDPGPLLRDVAEMVRPMLGGDTVLTVAVDADLPALVTDRGKLRQVLLNLSSNACKFTTRGQVTLGAARAPAGGVEFRVSDTGIGMSAEFLQQLFTPFTQARTGPQGRFSGSGLGLAISKRLGDLLGATLRVQSASGTGTTFTLAVPARHVDATRHAA